MCLYVVKRIKQRCNWSYLMIVNAGNSSSSEAGASSYRDGYSDCAREVATYLGRLHDSPGGVLVRTRVLAHLSAGLRAVNSSHRRQLAPPTASRLPVPVATAVDEHCRVTTSFGTAAASAAASSTSDSRLAAPAATGTCLADVKSHSVDGASAWLDTAVQLQRPATPPEDQKHHVTTTTLTSPTYDVNGNDVTTRHYRRSTPPALLFADDKQDTSIVWRPW